MCNCNGCLNNKLKSEPIETRVSKATRRKLLKKNKRKNRTTRG